MPALVAGIHVLLAAQHRKKTWMAGTSPAMTGRDTTHNSTSFKLLSHDCGAVDHRFHLPEGDLARKIFHAAVGRYDDPLRRNERQRRPDARRDCLRRLDGRVGKIDDAKDDGLRRQVLEHPKIEPGLRRLDRDLLRWTAVELGQE